MELKQPWKSFSGDFVRNENRPWITLTYAQSLDGSIAGQPGMHEMIHFLNGGKPLTLSCPESMKLTHQLRAEHEGILVGINTILTDDPSLTVRFGIEGENPQPIVLDTSLRFPETSKLLTNPNCKKPWIITAKLSDDDPKNAQVDKLQQLGAQIIFCRLDEDGKIDIERMLELIHPFMKSVMVEGGASIIASFLKYPERLIDHVLLTVSPVFVGGVKGLQELLPTPLKLSNTSFVKVGQDIVIQGEVDYSHLSQ